MNQLPVHNQYLFALIPDGESIVNAELRFTEDDSVRDIEDGQEREIEG